MNEDPGYQSLHGRKEFTRCAEQVPLPEVSLQSVLFDTYNTQQCNEHILPLKKLFDSTRQQLTEDLKSVLTLDAMGSSQQQHGMDQRGAAVVPVGGELPRVR